MCLWQGERDRRMSRRGVRERERERESFNSGGLGAIGHECHKEVWLTLRSMGQCVCSRVRVATQHRCGVWDVPPLPSLFAPPPPPRSAQTLSTCSRGPSSSGRRGPTCRAKQFLKHVPENSRQNRLQRDASAAECKVAQQIMQKEETQKL